MPAPPSLPACLQLEAANKELGNLLVFLKESLSDRIEKVVLTDRLLDSPCALVTSKFGWSANMERIMRSQAMGDSRAMEYMKGRKILEINPQHEVVRGIKVGFGVGLEPASCAWGGSAGEGGRCGFVVCRAVPCCGAARADLV